MCLAVPMQIITLSEDGTGGLVELEGIRHRVGMMLIDEPKVGDYVIVHAGYAIEKLDIAEAEARLALFATLAEVYQREGGQEISLIASLRSTSAPP
ncbi:MAG: HypC/HybG/HupF family hydrogenase formation chaperone [Magnetococcales bacterium]|nr:HypC/HybG/HupF family hydrogenase formation chaperone [Magnetococcales bacterium]